MSMIKVGKIKALWRYPVKGMAGESLRECQLSEQGLLGDRILALKDITRQEIQSCKFRPELLLCIARLRETANLGNGEHVDITLPNGMVVGSDDITINSLLSTLIGHQSTLEIKRSAEDLNFYRRHKKDDHTWLNELKATFERETDEPLPDLDNLPQSAQDFVSVLGTFFLVSPIHLITTATLDYLNNQAPDADWSIERFRPNVIIETEPEFKGLIEQNWIGHQLHINNINIHCNGTTPRCGAITKPQQSFGKDTQVLRTVVAKANQNVGVYGETNNTGAISVGDEVFIQSN
jgi:uncharacterized protein